MSWEAFFLQAAALPRAAVTANTMGPALTSAAAVLRAGTPRGHSQGFSIPGTRDSLAHDTAQSTRLQGGEPDQKRTFDFQEGGLLSCTGPAGQHVDLKSWSCHFLIMLVSGPFPASASTMGTLEYQGRQGHEDLGTQQVLNPIPLSLLT